MKTKKAKDCDAQTYYFAVNIFTPHEGVLIIAIEMVL